MEPNGPYYQDFNGGKLFLGEGSAILFLNDLSINKLGALSVTHPDSVLFLYDLSGGCAYIDGELHSSFHGTATLPNSDVTAGRGTRPVSRDNVHRRRELCGGYWCCREMPPVSLTMPVTTGEASTAGA